MSPQRVELGTMEAVKAVIADVSYHDWELVLTPTSGVYKREAGRWTSPPAYTGTLQIQFSVDGVHLQHGRKWLVETSMTRSELLRTCLLAVLTCVEHEAREDFTYRGVPIYNPHTSPLA